MEFSFYIGCLNKAKEPSLPKILMISVSIGLFQNLKENQFVRKLWLGVTLNFNSVNL